MIRSGVNRISKKRLLEMPIYNVLIVELRELCGNISELSGTKPDWQSGYLVEPHHIGGRIGKKFLNPFNIIMLTRTEHDIENDYKEGCYTKEELLNIVKPIRIKQGYKER